jgi:hypothetical protein
MHELAIPQGIVEMIVERTDSARITAVYLRISKVSGVVLEAVRFCFDRTNQSLLSVPGGRQPSGECRGSGLVDPPGADPRHPAVVGQERRARPVPARPAAADPGGNF